MVKPFGGSRPECSELFQRFSKTDLNTLLCFDFCVEILRRCVSGVAEVSII